MVAPEDDQYNEHHRGNVAFSSYRVPHKRHKRLLANSDRATGRANGNVRVAARGTPPRQSEIR
jgi:hypothetical protein